MQVNPAKLAGLGGVIPHNLTQRGVAPGRSMTTKIEAIRKLMLPAGYRYLDSREALILHHLLHTGLILCIGWPLLG